MQPSIDKNERLLNWTTESPDSGLLLASSPMRKIHKRLLET